MKKIRLLLTLFVVSLCSWQSAWATEYVAPEWSIASIAFDFESSEWVVNDDGISIKSPSILGGEKSLSANFTATTGQCVSFEYDRYWYGELLIYIDNNLVMSITPDQGVTRKEYSINVLAGSHSITWLFKKGQSENAGYATIYNIGIKEQSQNLKYVVPNWSEYPIIFNTSWTDYSSSFSTPGIKQGETSMSATVSVDSEATLVFQYGTTGSWVSSQGDLRVYLDGVLKETVNSVEYNHDCRYFVEMGAGSHTITWTYERNNTSQSYVSIRNIGIMATPLISVNLLEPGSLGTEVLYQVDHVKKVRNLKIAGSMNDDDWAKIQMMPDLFRIDLSGTNIKSIANECFYNGSKKFDFLHFVRLPETLESIGSYAFNMSNIDDIDFPSSLKSIGSSAFSRTKIREAMLPNTMTEVGSGAFYTCRFLRKANFPENVKIVKDRTFQDCTQLTDLTLHEGLTEIQLWGIRSIPYSKRLPSTITTIGEGACADNWVVGDTLFIPEKCTYMGLAAFQECSKVKVVVVPVGYYDCSGGRDILNSSSINTLIIKSPTVLTGSAYTSIVPSWRRSAITLKVPDYLVNSYKLDSYWYEFGKIEGFSTAEIKDWVINRPLTLNNSRFEGKPNINLNKSGSLKINGDAPMTINNLFFTRDWNSSAGWNTQILSNCDNISIEGTVTMTHYCRPKVWTFVCLPFDVRVSEISNIHGAKYAIRYYDGANRAVNGIGGNWKNYSDDDIITAGTGFILQPNDYSSTLFTAIENEQKQLVVSNREFVKSLDVNISETPANRGWNLVGNPWHCYYNIHKLNFTAPITIWNPDNKTYTAYSLTDDDYAIRPNEAFFVQCPNEEYNTIGFPIQGRQLTSVIESQNASRGMTPQLVNRKVVNLTIGNGEMEDMTRVVLNEQASTAYEVSCDASKFMSMDGSVPQIYTLDTDGTRYAINERPMGDGFVTLGFYAGAEGTYTITATRCDAKKVYVTDQLMGVTKEINDAPYSFSAEAGTDNTRFVLSFVSGETTGIQEIGKTAPAGQTEVFSIDGKFLGTDASRLGTGIYIVRQGKQVSKVVVR